LKQAEAGEPLAELLRRVGVSEQTFYRWKKQYVGWEVDQVRQLKQLQEENTRLKQVVVADIYTRECLAIESEQRLKGEDMVQVLNPIKMGRGVHQMVHFNNDSEFCSQAMDLWAYQQGVRMAFSCPGKPTDNAFVVSLNGTFWVECLNAH
jgi:putative transposase